MIQENVLEITSREQFEQPDPITLSSGVQAFIRPIRPADAVDLDGFFSRLSPASFFLRFLEPRDESPADLAERLARPDYSTGVALVATRRQAGSIIGEARFDIYWPLNRHTAQVAIVVEDRYQRQGLGTLMFKQLAGLARQNGIKTLVSSICKYNVQVLYFFEQCGFPVRFRPEQKMCEIETSPAGNGARMIV